MQKKMNASQADRDEEDDSSIAEDNVPNPNLNDDVSKDSANDTKKKAREWNEKQSEIRKVFINNRAKDKKMQNDAAYDGIYLYKPGVQLPSLYQFANQTIKIIISSQYIKRHNPQILKRNIYGADPYTSNSDPVCILIHSGSLNVNTFPTKRFQGVQLICKVIKPKKNYTGSFKNGMMSRNLKGYNGNALKPETVRNLLTLGPMELLEKYAANMHIPIGKNRIKPRPKNISSMIPIPQTHIIFNMNNEPAYKYSIFNIADKGFQKNQFITKKLDNFVLYLETIKQQKFELLKRNEIDSDGDLYQLSKIKSPQKIDNEYFTNNKCPLECDMVDIIYDVLRWQQISWGNVSVSIRDQKIQDLKSFKYYKRQK